MTAQVKIHQGTPTVFIKDIPYFYRLMWGSPATADGYVMDACARRYAEANVHLFTFDMGTGGTIPDWCGM